jgi:hypothetical protein
MHQNLSRPHQISGCIRRSVDIAACRSRAANLSHPSRSFNARLSSMLVDETERVLSTPMQTIGYLVHIPLLMRLGKRSHGSKRVHVIPPMHNFAVSDGNDRDEPIVVG